MSGPGKVFLVGSGDLHVLRQAASAATHKEKPRVAVSFVAAPGSGGPRAAMQGRLNAMFPGSPVEVLAVAGEQGALAEREARRVLERADVVFMSGGDPVHGAQVLREAGADAWLREARERGTPFLGVSAGSMLLTSWWAAWDDDDVATLVPGAGVVPELVIDCHDEDSHWEELRAVRTLLQEKGLAGGLTFVGVPTGGAVVVGSDGHLSHLGASPFRLQG